MPLVSRVICDDYAQAREAVYRAVELVGGAGNFCATGEPVMIKANMLASHTVEQAVTTHPAIIEALIQLARDHNARPVVADSPAIASAARVARAGGIGEVCKRNGVEILDLGSGPNLTRKGRTFKAIELSRDALEAGYVWNAPKWKTHTMMGLTLGVKNLFGCVPGTKKLKAHFRVGRDSDAFALLLIDIWKILDPCLTVLDGIAAMEGAGPSSGEVIRRNMIMASADAPALDWEACRLSGFTPESVPTVRLTVEREYLDPAEIEVVGDEAEPMTFAPAPGSPTDFQLVPSAVKGLLRSTISPAPRFDKALCNGCRICIEACPAAALSDEQPPQIDKRACIRCYCCQELCPQSAVRVPHFARKASRKAS